MSRSILIVVCALLSACVSIAPTRPPPVPATKLITFGQVFDSRVPSAKDLSDNVSFVWSDNHNFDAAPGVAMGQYAAAYRSNAQPLAWFQANHPTWVMYLADQKTPAWEFGNTAFVPLDISNPDVVAFLEEGFAANAGGRLWLDLDNVDLENSYHAVGHYDVTGAWVARYTGKPGDPVWLADNDAYLTTLAAWAHAQGRSVMINNSANTAYIAVTDWLSLSADVDGTLIEGWPIDGCANDPPNWVSGYVAGTQFDREYQDVIGANVRPTFELAYLCGHSLAAATPREIAWITAVRLLTAGEGTSYLAAGGGSPLTDIDGIEPYPASMNPAVGPITGAPPVPGSRPYTRAFANGFVALNPTTSPVSVTVPAGADQFGNAVTGGPYTLAALSAVVIVTQ